MTRLLWAVVYGVACVLSMLVEWVKDHAQEQVTGKKRKPDDDDEDEDDDDPEDES